MKTLSPLLSVLLLLANACAAATDGDDSSSDKDLSGGKADVIGEPTEPTSGYEPRCDTGGVQTFNAYATGLDEYEGKTVWASAVEPKLGTNGLEPSVAVFLEGVVRDGNFHLDCEHGLSQNYNYPGAGIIIDVDDSGTCTPDDVIVSNLFYGWGLTDTGPMNLPFDTAQAVTIKDAGSPGIGDLDACANFFGGR